MYLANAFVKKNLLKTNEKSINCIYKETNMLAHVTTHVITINIIFEAVEHIF